MFVDKLFACHRIHLHCLNQEQHFVLHGFGQQQSFVFHHLIILSKYYQKKWNVHF